MHFQSPSVSDKSEYSRHYSRFSLLRWHHILLTFWTLWTLHTTKGCRDFGTTKKKKTYHKNNKTEFCWHSRTETTVLIRVSPVVVSTNKIWPNLLILISLMDMMSYPQATFDGAVFPCIKYGKQGEVVVNQL